MTPYLLTCTGREHILTHGYSAGPAPTIAEIAHALAQINRYTGHAARPYSVAEHSLLVCDIVCIGGCDCHAQLAALLHDAHEAFCGDAATPIKVALGGAWAEFERVHERLVQQTFRIESAAKAHHAAIKHADLVALATERRDLLPYDPARHLPWPAIDAPGAAIEPLPGVDLASPIREAMTWRRHRDAFSVRANDLIAKCDAHAAQLAAVPATPEGLRGSYQRVWQASTPFPPITVPTTAPITTATT
ncbi:MAG: hypothetical protein ACTS6O_06535, partial [Giesbergeria sp.]